MDNAIYCYHAPIQEIDQRECERQIELWKKSWTDAGWRPMVLNLSHAARHRDFRSLTPRLMRRPTSNPRNYEIACFHRWMAMASLDGGWMCDYDVLNLGFKPPILNLPRGLMLGFAQACPCLVYGEKSQYQRMIEFFDREGKDVEERGVMHYSDQVAFGQAIEHGLVEVHEGVVDYPQFANQPLSSLVHIKTDHANAVGMVKSAIMAKLLESIAA